MKRVLVVLGIAIAAFAAYVETRPAEFRVQRSEIIDAPPEVIFRNLDDFRLWAQWSPWEKLDPAMKRDYSGPASGVGASYQWRGNRRVGEGRMTVTERRAPARLAIRLELAAPLRATNAVELDVSPDIADTSEVRWTMTGQLDFIGKAVGLFTDMDRRVGADFEKGLVALKQLCEAEAAASLAAKAAAATAPPPGTVEPATSPPAP